MHIAEGLARRVDEHGKRGNIVLVITDFSDPVGKQTIKVLLTLKARPLGFVNEGVELGSRGEFAGLLVVGAGNRCGPVLRVVGYRLIGFRLPRLFPLLFLGIMGGGFPRVLDYRHLFLNYRHLFIKEGCLLP